MISYSPVALRNTSAEAIAYALALALVVGVFMYLLGSSQGREEREMLRTTVEILRTIESTKPKQVRQPCLPVYQLPKEKQNGNTYSERIY